MRQSGRTPGFSLVELVIAAALAAGLLSASWSWAWGLCASCRHGDASMEAASRIAAARRFLDAEVGSGRLAADTAPGCSDGRVTLAITHTDEPVEIVTYCWDAARRVLWRKAPGSHVAEDVTGFHVAYITDDGSPLACDADGGLSAADARRVRALRFSVTVGEAGASPLTRTWLTTVGAW